MNIPRTKQVSYIYDGSDFCYFFEYSQDTISSYLFIEYADNSFNGGWQFIINNMLEKYGEQAYKMLNPDTAEYVASYLVKDSTGITIPVYQTFRKHPVFNEKGQWLGNPNFKFLDTLSVMPNDTIVYEGIHDGFVWKWFHISYKVTVGYANVPINQKPCFDKSITSLRILRPDLKNGDNFWNYYIENEKKGRKRTPIMKLKHILLDKQF